MTWGHCHFVLHKSPEGKLTFERDKKASSCDANAPSSVSLESGSMWTTQTWAHVAALMGATASPSQCQHQKPCCQDTWHLTAPFIFYFCSAQISIKFWIEVEVKVEGQSEKLHNDCLGRHLISSFLNNFPINHSLPLTTQVPHVQIWNWKTIMSVRFAQDFTDQLVAIVFHSDLDLQLRCGDSQFHEQFMSPSSGHGQEREGIWWAG